MILRHSCDSGIDWMCRCQGTELSGALCEQPEESLRCLCAAAYEASPDYSLTCIAALPSFAAAILSTAKAEAGGLKLCLPLQQALTGVHSIRVRQHVLGMHLPEQAITIHLFNCKSISHVHFHDQAQPHWYFSLHSTFRLDGMASSFSVSECKCAKYSCRQR